MSESAARGSRIASRWELDTFLGDLGLGETWTARDTAGQPAEVLVELLGSPSPQGHTFDAVVAALRPLSNPGLLTVLAGGEERGRFYVVTERFDGRSLHNWLAGHRQQGTRPGFGVVQRIFEKVCNAVHFAHTASGSPVVHRGLTPRSVVLKRVGPGQHHIKVADLGLAPFAPGSVGTGATPLWEYMSPEQHGGRWVEGPGSDVFSLGVLLAEMLTLQATPRADTREPWWQHVRDPKNSVPDRLGALRPEVPRGVWDVIAVAMHPQAKSRHKDVQKFQRAVRDAWTQANEWDRSGLGEPEPPMPTVITTAAAAAARPGAAQAAAGIAGWQVAERASQPPSRPQTMAPAPPMLAPQPVPQPSMPVSSAMPSQPSMPVSSAMPSQPSMPVQPVMHAQHTMPPSISVQPATPSQAAGYTPMPPPMAPNIPLVSPAGGVAATMPAQPSFAAMPAHDVARPAPSERTEMVDLSRHGAFAAQSEHTMALDVSVASLFGDALQGPVDAPMTSGTMVMSQKDLAGPVAAAVAQAQSHVSYDDAPHDDPSNMTRALDAAELDWQPASQRAPAYAPPPETLPSETMKPQRMALPAEFSSTLRATRGVSGPEPVPGVRDTFSAMPQGVMPRQATMPPPTVGFPQGAGMQHYGSDDPFAGSGGLAQGTMPAPRTAPMPGSPVWGAAPMQPPRTAPPPPQPPPSGWTIAGQPGWMVVAAVFLLAVIVFASAFLLSHR